MNILLDSCVWGGVVPALEAAGHDVVWAGEWPTDPGDDEILMLANSEGRILITLDKDFGEMAVVHQRPHRGIIRLVSFAARRQAEACLQILDLHGEEISRGAIATAEPGMLRLRPPDSPSA